MVEVLLLYNTIYRTTLIDVAKFYNDKIYVSEHKYFPDLRSFIVFKEHKYSKIIEF